MGEDLSTLRGKLGMLERRHSGTPEALEARIEYDTRATLGQISARVAKAKPYLDDTDLQAFLYESIAAACAWRAAELKESPEQ